VSTRVIKIWDAGYESAGETFERDQLMLAAAAAEPTVGWWRVWQRPHASPFAGRYHRLPIDGTIARRLTGGRVVPVGPGVVVSTLVVSTSSMIDKSGARLRPEQVLNRALRPTLAALRDAGVDAFYPGRDAVTVNGKTVACASFTVTPDGLLLVEQFLAVERAFSNLRALMADADTERIAAVDSGVFDGSIALTDLEKHLDPAVEKERGTWVRRLASAARETWSAGVERSADFESILACATPASRVCRERFQSERGPLPGDHSIRASLSMLGVVEVSAKLSSGRISDLAVSGDVIAPFSTLDRVGSVCEGLVPAVEVVTPAVARAVRDDGGFVLGANDLASLIAGLA